MVICGAFVPVLLFVLHGTGAAVEAATTDFLLLAQGADISRLEVPTDTISTLSIHNLTFAHSVEFDSKRDCVFWADFTRIVRQCLADTAVQVLISTGVDRIEDLAYDWLSETLYYHDVGREKIVAVDVSAAGLRQPNRWRRTIYSYSSPIMVTAIAVHPEFGHLFWSQFNDNGSDYGPQDAEIHRVDFDGDNGVTLLQHPHLRIPVDLSVDYASDRLYWIDAGSRIVGSCDLDGGARQVERNLSAESTQAVEKLRLAVCDGVAYWTDAQLIIHVWNSSAGAEHEIPVRNGSGAIRNLKGYDQTSRMGGNACSDGTHNCTHFCVSKSNGRAKCLCPDALDMNGDGECVCVLGAEAKCYEHYIASSCEGRFQCKQDPYACIREDYVCDGKPNCLDASDEADCSNTYRILMILAAVSFVLKMSCSMYCIWRHCLRKRLPTPKSSASYRVN